MQRDPRAFLWDVRESALAIQGFIAGMGSDAYAANDLVQAGVERKFEIIGEALNQLAKLDAPLAARIPECRRLWPFATS
ncbi:HepT-like ribonuclease domain-containing protein [Rhodoferax sp.]|uniref:HepT-like ribonuclease domain-containing protein n=1 Tax=Rhodoferax sp. TaxID=50421 RepID=UPI0025D83B7C|nr:HepT-like ribonuclease domain-containing protein [Rhodoferax sp.]